MLGIFNGTTVFLGPTFVFFGKSGKHFIKKNYNGVSKALN